MKFDVLVIRVFDHDFKVGLPQVSFRGGEICVGAGKFDLDPDTTCLVCRKPSPATALESRSSCTIRLSCSTNELSPMLVIFYGSRAYQKIK